MARTILARMVSKPPEPPVPVCACSLPSSLESFRRPQARQMARDPPHQLRDLLHVLVDLGEHLPEVAPLRRGADPASEHLDECLVLLLGPPDPIARFFAAAAMPQAAE